MIKIYVKVEHIKYGERHSCSFCPVARAIKDALGVAEGVRVTANCIWIGNIEMPTPPRAKTFINSFDTYRPSAEPFSFELPIHRKAGMNEWELYRTRNEAILTEGGKF